MTIIEQTAGRGALDDWSSIHWPAAERNVRRLQERIFRASQNGERAQVKNLQKLLVRSRSAKLLATRRVTQINRGKKTPGIDGVVCPGPSSPPPRIFGPGNPRSTRRKAEAASRVRPATALAVSALTWFRPALTAVSRPILSHADGCDCCPGALIGRFALDGRNTNDP